MRLCGLSISTGNCSAAAISLVWTPAAEQFFVLLMKRLPNRIGGVADSVLLNQFASHSREHVVIVVDTLQAFSGKLAFHGESDQQLLTHEAQTRGLHGAFVAHELHTHATFLPNSPGAPRGLSQGM